MELKKLGTSLNSVMDEIRESEILLEKIKPIWHYFQLKFDLTWDLLTSLSGFVNWRRISISLGGMNAGKIFCCRLL